MKQTMPATTRAIANQAALQGVSIEEMITASQRLADLLSEESEYLDRVEIKAMESLQDEKLRLTKMLEACQARLATDKEFLRRATPQQREALLLLADDLAYVVEENFRRVSVARAVNSRVMQAISDATSDRHQPSTYTRAGLATNRRGLTVSINLNQRA